MPGQSLFHEAKPTFSGGEFSPEMYARIDLAKYTTGLKTARNVFVHPQGGVSNRSGLRYVAASRYNNKKCRLIPFEFSDEQSYILEFGNQYIRFYVNGGQITGTSSVNDINWVTAAIYSVGDYTNYSGSPYRCAIAHTAGVFATDLAAGKWVLVTAYEIASPYLEADLPLLKYTQSADTLYFAHPDYAPMTLVRNADNDWTLADFPFINGPYRNENTSPTTLSIAANSGTVVTASSPIFNAQQMGSSWRVDAEIPAQTALPFDTWVGAFTPGPWINSEIVSNRDFNVTTKGTWAGSFKVQKSTDGINWTDVSQVFSSNNDTNFNVNGDAGEQCFLRLYEVTLSAGHINVAFSAQAFTAKQILVATSFVSSTQMFMSGQGGIIPFALGDPWTSTEWFEGAWSTYRGWPSAVTFYQDRLGWASTPDNPLGNWWSKTGNYVDYGVSDPLVDDDAISVNFPTRKLNQCQHLIPLSVVLALTSSGEISIGPGGSGDFTPTSIDLRPQTYHGAASVPPVIVGNQAIFVQARSSQVRNISYQYFTNIFTGEILNLMSTHLFSGYTLSDMTYAESPDSIVYAVRSDGVLLCFTYMPEQQVMGWTHWDTNGTFESCCVIPATTYDELWVVVNRTNGRFIERLAQRLPTTNTQDQFHVDCGIDYSGPAVKGISGLTHLNGQSVIVLADGIVQGPFTVSAGAITLTKAASLAHIGLAYTADVETLNIERAGQDGTGQDRRTRATQATMRFVNSLGGYVGASSDKLHLIVPNPGTGLLPLFTGDIQKISIPPDWQSNGRIFFRQTAPLPFTLTGVFLATESGNI